MLPLSIALNVITFIFIYFKCKQIKQLQTNRDIPEIVKIEQDRLEILKKRVESEKAERIKKGEKTFQIPLSVLKQVTNELKSNDITIKFEGLDIRFSDYHTILSYKVITDVQPKNHFNSCINFYSKPCVYLDVDRKELAKALRALSAKYIQIYFNLNNPTVFYFKDSTHTVSIPLCRSAEARKEIKF